MNYRRYYVPNSIVFITQVVAGRQPVFAHGGHLDLLRHTLRTVREHHPFTMLAYVFLPDHFHLLVRPRGDSDCSAIMASLKKNFTRAYKQAMGISGRMHFWQRRFWDHVIRDERDLQRHMDYIHYNPVRHGLVRRPEEWPHSSYRAWQERGAYGERWGWSQPALPEQEGGWGE